jgi:hypothetical protein
MPARRRANVLLLAALSVLALSVGTHTQQAHAFGVPLYTGIDVYTGGPEGDQTLTHVKALGAQFLRITFSWNRIAPASPPPGFEPANPDDPSYQWGDVDKELAAIVARGLTPLVGIARPPAWGQSPVGAGENSPDPNQLALFTRAFAARYNGLHPGLPWVRDWEVWNEPNATYFLEPQIQENRIVSVDTYRAMINAVSAAVHGVRPDDVVVGGALFPNGLRRATETAIAPLEFVRGLFCLSAGPHPHKTCNTQVNVDAMSVHPYTTGGPSTLPANPDNVWIDNLGALTALDQAAQRLGTLVSANPVQTWVTEFSWDSSPPDPKGVPAKLEQRWVAETLYRAWQGGVSVFTWYSLRDQPYPASYQQAGLYYECPQGVSCDTPKPAAGAFRFPFVAYSAAKRRVLVWGRTPEGVPGKVQVQWLRGRSWKRLATLTTDSDGIFTARPSLPRGANPKSALLRAVQSGGSTSPSFSLQRIPDILVKPFGS